MAALLASLLFSSFLWVVVNLQNSVETAYGVAQINSEARLLDNLMNEVAFQKHTVSAPLMDNWIPGILDSDTTNISGIQTLSTINESSLKIGDNSYVKIMNDRLYFLSDGTDPEVNLNNFSSSETNTTVFCTATFDPHPNCIDTEQISVQGMVNSFTFDRQTRNLGSHYLEGTITLSHPFLTYRDKSSGFYRSAGESFFFAYVSDTIGIETDGGTSTVPKTGQITCYDTGGNMVPCVGTGQDGGLLKGIKWPAPRFTNNTDGTVTDNLTDLVWLKNANCFGFISWENALTNANNLASGSCDLTDESNIGDWYLPSIKQLQSIVDSSRFNPVLPSDTFTGIQSSYWSSTTLAHETTYAWSMDLSNGYVSGGDKIGNRVAWPVRER